MHRTVVMSLVMVGLGRAGQEFCDGVEPEGSLSWSQKAALDMNPVHSLIMLSRARAGARVKGLHAEVRLLEPSVLSPLSVSCRPGIVCRERLKSLGRF